jgi:glutaredoxin
MSDSQTAVITLYVIPDCPLCERLRAELRRRAISFQERDVANNFAALRQMYRLTKQRFVPVIERNGIALVRPDAEELERLLNNT